VGQESAKAPAQFSQRTVSLPEHRFAVARHPQASQTAQERWPR